MDGISELIRQSRVQARLSGKELGQRIGVPQQRVSDWERGRRFPTWEHARALGRFFQRDPMEFYERTGAEPDGNGAPFQYASSAQAFSRPWPIPFWGQERGFCPHGCVYFDEDFLEKFDLNPVQCAVIEVRNSSMAPTLPLGSVCLADRRHTSPVEGAIYALERYDDLLIRRAREGPHGWVLETDAADYQSVPWNAEIVVVGVIIWTARMLRTDIAERPELVIAKK